MTKPVHRKPVILTLLGCLWPGNDASGPNQSFRAMATALADEFEFAVVARDRAFGASQPAVRIDGWQREPGFRIRYVPATAGSARELSNLLRATDYDLLVLNGFFDREFTIPALLMRRFGLVPARPTILSPRGEFSHGAPDISPRRKRAWIAIARHLRLLSDVSLHATSEAEADDIARHVSGAAGIVLAPNLRPLIKAEPWHPATDGRLRLSFIGRISPKKNVDLAVSALAKVRTPAVFDVFGPSHEQTYADRCKSLCAALPAHIEVRWRGEIENADVARVLAGTDLFLHPSASENFGHSIFEALCCGVPVMVGRHTPWQDLEARKAGFDLPLDSIEGLAGAIDGFATLASAARAAFRAGARACAERYVRDSDASGRLRTMFRDAFAADVATRPHVDATEISRA